MDDIQQANAITRALNRYLRRQDRKFPAWIDPEGVVHVVPYERYGWDGHSEFAAQQLYGKQLVYDSGKNFILSADFLMDRDECPGPPDEERIAKQVRDAGGLSDDERRSMYHRLVADQEAEIRVWQIKTKDKRKRARKEYDTWVDAWEVLCRRGWVRVGYSHYSPMLRRDVLVWTTDHGLSLAMQTLLANEYGLEIEKAFTSDGAPIIECSDAIYGVRRGAALSEPIRGIMMYHWDVNDIKDWSKLPAEKALVDNLTTVGEHE